MTERAFSYDVPLVTAKTWNNKDVDCSDIVNAALSVVHDTERMTNIRILVPGCGRGRIVADMAVRLSNDTSLDGRTISFDCVDTKREELEAFSDYLLLKSSGFEKENDGGCLCKCLVRKGIVVNLWQMSIQKFLDQNNHLNSVYEYDLIIALLFFHYIPDCWVSVLFDLLGTLKNGGAFLVDRIIGSDYRSQLLMRSLDSNNAQLALPQDDYSRVASSFFSVSLDKDTLEKEFKNDGVPPEELENIVRMFITLLRKNQSFFARKLKERSSFWGSSIKATDISILCYIIEGLFSQSKEYTSSTFMPRFLTKHLSWIWGEKLGNCEVYPEVIDDINQNRLGFDFKVLFNATLHIRFNKDFLKSKNLRKHAYEISKNESLRQFSSLPWVFTQPCNGDYSIREAASFSKDGIPQCMIQAILSSGILNSISDLDNIFLCFNPPIQKVSLVQNLVYAFNLDNREDGSTADRFLANAVYHAEYLKHSLSSTLFKKGICQLIYSKDIKFDKEFHNRHGFIKRPVTKASNIGWTPDWRSCKGRDSCRFLLHWALGGHEQISDIKSLASEYKHVFQNYRKSDLNKEQEAIPLEIMDLQAIFFIPFLGFRWTDAQGNLTAASNSFLGLALGIRKLTTSALDEALRVASFAEQLAVRANDSQLALYWCYKSELASIRSAIGTIMSRNGSHNIGSHVLAALSHNVGTMPDDRVLYQYIQHRMDYIATATTEFPSWRQPTMFLGTIIKNFLSQRHLLDHIAESEGLKGWKFQHKGERVKYQDIKNKSRIKFHIYPYVGGKRGKERIDYDNSGCMQGLTEDIALAIPGGTVGQHAFFTILENIVRNAAKHDWSSRAAKCKKAEAMGDTEKAEWYKSNNLEINIDYEDCPEEGNIVFTISSNMSNANENDGVQTLFQSINDKLARQFINSQGVLRRENWGLAEMKISAGFLQRRELGVIGGLESYSEKAKADSERFGEKIIEVIPQEDGHLAFRFRVPKARTLLIITKNVKGKEENYASSSNRLRNLASKGIYIRNESEVLTQNADNSFEFVLMDKPNNKRDTWHLPSRVVYPDEGTTVKDILSNLSNGTLSEEKLLDSVAAKRIKQLWQGKTPLNLVVAPFASGKNGQSLVNEAAAVSFVLTEGFEKAVESFWLLYPRNKQSVSDTETHEVMIFLRQEAFSSGISKELIQNDSKNFGDLLKTQFSKWLENAPDSKFGSIRDYLKNGKKLEKSHKFLCFIRYFGQVCRQAKGYLGQYAEKIITLPLGFEGSVPGEDSFGPELWEDANIFVCKEEKTGNVFSHARNPTVCFMRHYDVEVKPNDISTFVKEPFTNERSTFKYIEPLSGSQSYLVQMQTLRANDRIFQAKLVECALTRIMIIDERVSKFAVTHSSDILAVLALINIAVVDDKAVDSVLDEGSGNKENVAGLVELFSVDEIKNLRNDLAASGNTAELLALMNKRKNVYEYIKKKYGILGILIIHQGILDKWFRGLVDDENKMAMLLEALQTVAFSQVIITTGRGTPANIPVGAKVLPFSTIETTLFRKYPEKLVLVDAIMNILPICKH